MRIAAEAGLTHAFPNGGDKTKEYIIETTGSGVAFIDYDNDGYVDVFVVSGRVGTNRMYRQWTLHGRNCPTRPDFFRLGAGRLRRRLR